MADLTATNVKNISPVNEIPTVAKPALAGEALEQGDAVAYAATGKVVKTIGKGFGLAYRKTPSGEPVDVIIDGSIYGFDLTGIDPGTTIYYSQTAGALCTDADDGNGTNNMPAGMVTTLTDGTKVITLGRTQAYVPTAVDPTP